MGGGSFGGGDLQEVSVAEDFPRRRIIRRRRSKEAGDDKVNNLCMDYFSGIIKINTNRFNQKFKYYV